MAQSNLRAPQCEALVLVAEPPLFQERERPHHRNDRPGRDAYDNKETDRFGQEIAFHLLAEELIAHIAERSGCGAHAVVRDAKISASWLVMEIGSRMFRMQSTRRFVAAMGSKLS